MTKYKAGDTIQVPETLKQELKEIKSNMTCDMTLWEKIKLEYPELKNVKDASYNYMSGIITIK